MRRRTLRFEAVMGAAPLPLAGLRVLDFTRVLAGPLCTMMLGDLGAWVLKVERPGGGDDTRGWGPPFDPEGESAYFLAVNRNKLSLAADLDRPEDRRLLEGLIAAADLVVDNFRAGTLERRGLDPARLLERHPRLLWCSLTGFGPDDPRPGYDVVIQAECGWMAITGEPDGRPMKMGVALADVVAGKDAAVEILAALVARGAGPLAPERRRIAISLARSAAAALVNVAQNALVTGEEPARWGNAHPNLVPYQLFETADRPIVIAVGSDAQWLACARALGLDRLAADPELATNAGRVRQRERVTGELARRLRERPGAFWMERLRAAGVPAGRVRPVLEVLADLPASPLWGVAPVGAGMVARRPPKLDEHGALIRRDGWGAFEG